MPKMRGRPKGHKLTTVGLPLRKGKGTSKPTSFIDLHISDKQKGTLIFSVLFLTLDVHAFLFNYSHARMVC